MSIAEELAQVCTCRFVAIGVAMDATGCVFHEGRKFACDFRACHGTCHCSDYRPAKDVNKVGKWPVCVCGHIAQDHNS